MSPNDNVPQSKAQGFYTAIQNMVDTSVKAVNSLDDLSRGLAQSSTALGQFYKALVVDFTGQGYIDKLVTSVATFYKTAQDATLEALNNDFENYDSEIRQMAGELGNFSKERFDSFNKAVAGSLEEIGALGYKYSDVLSFTKQVADEVGSTVKFTSEQYTKLFTTFRGLDIRPEEGAKLVANLKNVGMSTQRITGVVNKLMNDSAKKGLNVKKVFDNFLQNYEKMNMLSFKNGVAGMQKMAMQATKLRMDMGKVMDLAESLYSPEKAIEATARLTTLGGKFAEAFGDPFQVMYEARNEPEKLQQKLADMTKEAYKFNTVTNQFDISPEMVQSLKEAGDILGYDISEMKKAGLVQAKMAEFNKRISNANIEDKDTKELIAGLADMNERGELVVNIGGEEKLVNSLDKNQVDALAKQTQMLNEMSDKEIALETLNVLKAMQGKATGLGQKTAFTMGSKDDRQLRNNNDKFFQDMFTSNQQMMDKLTKAIETRRSIFGDSVTNTKFSKAADGSYDVNGDSGALIIEVGKATKTFGDSVEKIQTSMSGAAASILQNTGAAQAIGTAIEGVAGAIDWTAKGISGMVNKITDIFGGTPTTPAATGSTTSAAQPAAGKLNNSSGTISAQQGLESAVSSKTKMNGGASQASIDNPYHKKTGGIVKAAGGVVNGPSHEKGGVQMSTQNNNYELEGNESVINKNSTNKYYSMLSQINEAGGGNPFPGAGQVTPQKMAEVLGAANMPQNIYGGSKTLSNINEGDYEAQNMSESNAVNNIKNIGDSINSSTIDKSNDIINRTSETTNVNNGKGGGSKDVNGELKFSGEITIKLDGDTATIPADQMSQLKEEILQKMRVIMNSSDIDGSQTELIL